MDLYYLKNPINVWNVHKDRISSTFDIEFHTELIHTAFDPKKKTFKQIKTIPEVKTINIAHVITEGEIIHITSNYILYHNNDKYS